MTLAESGSEVRRTMRVEVTMSIQGTIVPGNRPRAISIFSVNHVSIFVHKAIARFVRHEQSHQLKSPRSKHVAYDRSITPRPDVLDARLELSEFFQRCKYV